MGATQSDAKQAKLFLPNHYVPLPGSFPVQSECPFQQQLPRLRTNHPPSLHNCLESIYIYFVLVYAPWSFILITSLSSVGNNVQHHIAPLKWYSSKNECRASCCIKLCIQALNSDDSFSRKRKILKDKCLPIKKKETLKFKDIQEIKQKFPLGSLC